VFFNFVFCVLCDDFVAFIVNQKMLHVLKFSRYRPHHSGDHFEIIFSEGETVLVESNDLFPNNGDLNKFSQLKIQVLDGIPHITAEDDWMKNGLLLRHNPFCWERNFQIHAMCKNDKHVFYVEHCIENTGSPQHHLIEEAYARLERAVNQNLNRKNKLYKRNKTMKANNAGGSDGWRDKARWRNGNGLSL